MACQHWSHLFCIGPVASQVPETYFAAFTTMFPSEFREPQAFKVHPTLSLYLQLNLMYLPAEDLTRGMHAGFRVFNAAMTASGETKHSEDGRGLQTYGFRARLGASNVESSSSDVHDLSDEKEHAGGIGGDADDESDESDIKITAAASCCSTQTLSSPALC